MNVDESGHDFEIRALSIARAIHDPFGLQGAVMYGGSERDAVFAAEDQIHAYEFTTERTKAKAQKDANKLASMLRDLSGLKEHAYKALTGWFVTREEPTADQRGAVEAAAKAFNVRLHPISVSTLHRRICDSESYLQARDNAPFGSIAYAPAASGADFRVDVSFLDQDANSVGMDTLAARTIGGERSLIVGEFGVGKSHALRQLYRTLRKEHFRRSKLTPFPVHINLRECTGLKTPAEILRRHAENIGFASPNSLISAWRSGACILLLDGFDEVVPVRWLGGIADLKTVRWEAMAPLRKLVEETPSNTSIVLCGRAHYFSSAPEMAGALGLGKLAQRYELTDFNEDQIRQYLAQAHADWAVPDWIPGRPLLIGYLAAMEELASTGSGTSKAAAWRQLLSAICLRESRMYTAVRPETIEAILSRVATLARSTGNEIGPVGMELMRAAFIDVNGRQPDEEGIQLLLRLPGLTTDSASSDNESRLFVDRDLADAAYGEDLAGYLINPHGDHPLRSVASWVSASTDLGIEVAADSITEASISGSAVLAIATSRQAAGRNDSILVDLLRVASELDQTLDVRSSYLIEGVIFDSLTLSSDDPLMRHLTFRNCLFQRVDLSSIDGVADCPRFHGGMIGLLDGVAAIPPWLAERFSDVEIASYSSRAQTNAGIMQLSLSTTNKIALSILKKVYLQGGSGRKEGALSRGLDLNIRPLVAGVIAAMVSQGWLQKSSAGRNTLYVAVRDRRVKARRALESPGDFSLD